MQGGDDFARMIVNPNRPDLLGKLISTNYEDANGKKFREEFMENIRKKGILLTSMLIKNQTQMRLNKKSLILNFTINGIGLFQLGFILMILKNRLH